MPEQSKNYSMPVGIKVCIPWTRNDWNIACAWAIEHYGLSGEKFTTRPGDTGIEFYFKDEKDAMMFELCCG